jgi:hypothetical protein
MEGFFSRFQGLFSLFLTSFRRCFQLFSGSILHQPAQRRIGVAQRRRRLLAVAGRRAQAQPFENMSL